VGAHTPTGLARLDEQRLVVLEVAQLADDRVEASQLRAALPVPP
jgi:hypothetical protein